jgi:predicted nucleic acid-binding protein
MLTIDGNVADIVRMFANKKILLCYSAPILTEYKMVLNRPKFAFEKVKIGIFISRIRADGLPVSVRPSVLAFADETDRKFYDVAKSCGATRITGNQRHFPDEPLIQTAAAFLAECKDNKM